VPHQKQCCSFHFCSCTTSTEPRSMVRGSPILDAPPVDRALLAPGAWRLAPKLQPLAFCFKGRLTAPPPPEQTGPRDTQSSTMHTEPRGIITDTPISDAPPVKRALLAPHKRARGGPLSVGQNALCGPCIAQGTPNQKCLSKSDRQWQSVSVAFLRFGGNSDRQRRRRVRCVETVLDLTTHSGAITIL